MNTTKALLILSALVISLGAETASAQRRYYTREDVMKCDNAGRNSLIGGVVGGVAGAILGNGRALPTIAGAAAGGLLGLGLSCRQEAQYVENVDYHLHSRKYMDPYESDDMRLTVVRSGRSRYGDVCRTYYIEHFNGRHWVGRTKTACWVGNRWEHGYESNIYVGKAWMRSGWDHHTITYYEIYPRPYRPYYSETYYRPVYYRPAPRHYYHRESYRPSVGVGVEVRFGTRTTR